MQDYADTLLGRRAVEAGLVSEESLQACLREQDADSATGKTRRPLAQLLVERGHATEERIRALFSAAIPIASRGDSPTIADAPSTIGDPPSAVELSREMRAEDATIASALGPPRPAVDAPARPAGHEPGAAGIAERGDASAAPRGVPSVAGATPGASHGTRSHPAGPHAAPPASPAPEPARASEGVPAPGPGSFGRYRIEAEIARGGMGVVYRAFDTQVKRIVALKVMLGGDAVPGEARRRFEREALLAARLHHPNVVPVYEVGELEGKLYFTMELIEGDSLQQVLHRMKAIPPRAALRIARDVARALEHAHERNLIHRDIKPGNILITKAAAEGPAAGRAADSTLTLSGSQVTSFRVLVADFGLAKDVTSDTLLTRDGNVIGTPMYMSPEQAGGDLERVGPRSDIYSLGAVMYEMLCGRKPFLQDSAVQLLAAVILDDPVPLRRHAPGLHPDIGTVVAKAMEKDPDRRYPSAKAFAEDIDRYLAGEIICARPTGPLYRMWRATVRRRAVVVPTALALLAIAAVLGWPSLRASWEARRARLERQVREHASAAALAASRAALEHGDADGARRLAEALVEEFAPRAEAGEDHPLAQAHATLAEAHRRAGDEPQALRERFRAYRAATRRGDARAFLLGMGRELVDQSRFDEARGILLRAARAGHGDAVAAETSYWQARIDESTLEFEAARDGFRAALAGPLPEALRTPAAEHLEFSTLLSGEAALPLGFGGSGGVLVPGDLDGDGRNELCTVAGGGVAVGTLAPDGTWTERWRFVCGPEEFLPPSTVYAADLDGDGRAEVLAASGSDQRPGALRVLRLEHDTLVEKARAPLRTQLAAQPLAAADLDGDGTVEVILGTGPYERSVHVWTWHGAENRLEERTVMPAGGDVIRVLVRNVDDDPAPEVLVFAGAWSAYAIHVLRWQRDRLGRVRTIHLGWPTMAEEIGGAGAPGGGPGASPASQVGQGASVGPATFVVGNSWYRGNLHPMAHLLGLERFRAKYRPPGIWLCRFDREPGKELEALEAGDWADGDDGAYGACLIRGVGRLWLWIAGRMNGFADRPAEEAEARPAGSVWVGESGGWRRLARLSLSLKSRFLSRGDQFLAGVTAVDVDGDGDDEVVFSEGGALRVRGLPGAGAAARAVAPPAAADAAPGPASGTLDALDAGRDAERVGLWEDALETYTRLLLRSDSAAELLAAGVGRLRCLGAIGRHQELAREAARLVQDWPGREQDLLPPCVDALCAGREWALAAGLVALQLTAPGLDPERRREARARAEELAGLAREGKRTVLVGPGAVPADWLLSAPFVATPTEHGATFTIPTGAGTFAVLPVSLDWQGAEIAGDLEPERLDWAVSLTIALADAPPWAEGGAPSSRFLLGFSAGGDTGYPQRTLWSESHDGRSGSTETLVYRAEGLPGRLDFSLQCLPHPQRLAVRVAERGHEPVLRMQRAGPPGGSKAWIGWSGSSYPEIGFWARVHCRGLALVSHREEDGVRAFVPVGALDHFVLANGRWAFGRDEEAAKLYDVAVRLAEDDWATEEKHLAEGLPSTWTGANHLSHARWTAVDARFARGLLRWSRGQRADGLEDLRAARRLSAERLLRLVALWSPVLAERPSACEALSELWLEEAGRPKGQALLEFAARTWRQVGGIEPAFRVLLGAQGLRAERFLEVTAIDRNGPLAKSGLQPGDEVAEIDGKPVATQFDWNEARVAAERRGAEKVRVVFRRGKARAEVELPPDLKGLDLEERVRVVR